MLTETDIKALKPHPERHRWVNDSQGLYLRVAPSGRRSWVWRSKRNGKTSYFTIGEWPDLSVKAARLALAKRTGRATPPNALTVKDAIGEWFADQIEPRYRRLANTQVYMRRVVAEFGPRRLQELTRAELARSVRRYAKGAPIAGNRYLQTLKLWLGWAVETGLLETSPAAGLTRRIAGGSEKSRTRVLTDDEIRALWRLEFPHANLLRALLLTGCRIGELQRATEAHVDGDWLTVPAEHAKNRREHRVFITDALRAQFDGAGGPLFRSRNLGAVQAWLSRRHAGSAPWSAHDLRRSFATRIGELGVAPHVIGRLLNHTPQGATAIYDRSELLEERIAATKLWAAELARIVR